MAKIVEENPSGKYLCIPESLFYNEKISSPAIITYMVIATFAYGNKTTCMPSTETVAAIRGLGYDTVIKHVKELVDAGVLQKDRRGLKMSNVYTFTAIPAEFQKATEAKKKALKTEKIGSDVGKSQLPDVGKIQHESLQVEALQEETIHSISNTVETNTESTSQNESSFGFTLSAKQKEYEVCQQGQFKDAPLSKLQDVYLVHQGSLFSELTGLGQVPEEIKEDTEEIAGYPVGSKGIADLIVRYNKRKPETRTWKDLELDFLRAHSITFPRTKAVKFPSYASFRKEDGGTENTGMKFAGQMKRLFDQHGYLWMKGYVEWCVLHWDDIRDIKWLNGLPPLPTPMLLVQRFNTFSPFYQAGGVDKRIAPNMYAKSELATPNIETRKEWEPPKDASCGNSFLD